MAVKRALKEKEVMIEEKIGRLQREKEDIKRKLLKINERKAREMFFAAKWILRDHSGFELHITDKELFDVLIELNGGFTDVDRVDLSELFGKKPPFNLIDCYFSGDYEERGDDEDYIYDGGISCHIRTHLYGHNGLGGVFESVIEVMPYFKNLTIDRSIYEYIQYSEKELNKFSKALVKHM